MGRFATAAIITLALAGAAVESRAGDLPGFGPDIAASPGAADPGAGLPVEQLLADAAPTPGVPLPRPVGGPMTGPMGAMPPGPGPRPMAWGPRPGMDPMMGAAPWRLHEMERTWGLFFNQRDKNLSDSDVQVLAQAILLVHGNHDWKVIDVADAADGQATFAYATGDGSVIARFSIDRHSGRITRIG